jgi:hypothetical protein
VDGPRIFDPQSGARTLGWIAGMMIADPSWVRGNFFSQRLHFLSAALLHNSLQALQFLSPTIFRRDPPSLSGTILAI